MQSVAPDAEVRLAVAQSLRTLSASAENSEVIRALRTLNTYVDDEEAASGGGAAQRAEFRTSHYTRTLQVLISEINADWLQVLSADQRTELWDGLFLRGPPEQSLLVLMEGIGSLSPSAGLDSLVHILETFLRRGGLAELLWSYCQRAGPCDSPQLRETLLGRLVGLPDLTANRLHPNTRELFLPQRYYPLLAQEIQVALERTCQALRADRDCSLTFVAQTLGKACIHGHSAVVFAVLAPRLSLCTRSDMVWQRVCWKLMENVPERWLEAVLSALVQAVSGPEALSRIVGNLVLRSKKAEFVMTHKLLLLQYKYETGVLRTLLGYLAGERDRRPLLIQALRSLCQTWSNPSSVRHTPLEQQLYVSRALLLCVGLLGSEELQELRPELLQCMLGGLQSHLDSNVVRLRRVGMVVGESLSSCMDPGSTRLQFQYEKDEETEELRSLVSPVVVEEPESSSQINSPHSNGALTPPPQEVPDPEPQRPAGEADSELDSDDELTPYDMSGDVELHQALPPRYLRDCLEALQKSEDPTRVELSLRAAAGLVRKNVSTAREVSVQMTKILLHMEDRFSVAGFLVLRLSAMVSLAVTDCVPVTQYLTTEFYSLNYSLRQRLDILEVLAASAQELSQPVTAANQTAAVAELSSYPGDDPAHWRRVVERRIQSKTRIISKGSKQPPPQATPNRFAPVAGYFFFPLLRNYDRPQVTFDLLGSDHLVLGRLVHTMGLLMHLAVNAPVSSQMGRALLDFVWALRYHADQVVRRGVLFSVCTVFLSMPSESLMVELSDQLLETRAWLADVADGDADADCRNLAVQSLLLLDKSIKKQLEPQGVGMTTAGSH